MHIVPVNEIPKEITPVPLDDLMKIYKTCQEMAVLCEKSNGIGLSAVQVGIPWQLFVIRNLNNNYSYYLNCNYEVVNDTKIKSSEGCLSLRYSNGELKYYLVERFKKIRVIGLQLLDNNILEISPINKIIDDELYNIVFQHEIDHHFSKLISDFGKEISIHVVAK